MVFVRAVGLGVLPGVLGDFKKRLLAALPKEEVASVGIGGEEGWILGVDVVAVFDQFEVVDNALLEQGIEVSAG